MAGDPRCGLGMLNELLAAEGPQRVLLLADTSQTIYQRGFTVPGNDEGWARCELLENCRNTSQIATLLRRRQGGASTPIAGPESEAVHFVNVADHDQAAAVGVAIDVILDEQDRGPESTLVCTTSSAMRNRLIEQYAFVPMGGSQPP